jgi:hypothetical protein
MKISVGKLVETFDRAEKLLNSQKHCSMEVLNNANEVCHIGCPG